MEFLTTSTNNDNKNLIYVALFEVTNALQICKTKNQNLINVYEDFVFGWA